MAFIGEVGESVRQQVGGQVGDNGRGFDGLGFDKTTTAVSVRKCEREQ
jgi:hypothetical protein